MLNKIVNRYKQFGFIWLLKTILFYPIRYIYHKKNFVIVALNKRTQNTVNNKIVELSKKLIQDYLNKGIISNNESKKFSTLLNQNSEGYILFENDELAAYGFVQKTGHYFYGKNNLYTIPPEVNIFKNLYVKPKFRGMSLGNKINVARIQGVPYDIIPVVFLVSENVIALRNLKSLGFVEYISIENILLFNKIYKRNINVLNSDTITEKILTGFNLK